MRTPSRALPAWPKGLLDGCGRPFAAAFFEAGFFAFSFTTLFDAALDLGLTFVLPFAFFLFALPPPPSPLRLFCFFFFFFFFFFLFFLFSFSLSSKSSIDVAHLFLAKH